VREGGEISVHYDPMIAKLIATGETRDAALHRARAALRQYVVLGIRTNIPLLTVLLEHPRFVSGDIDTHLLDTEGDRLRAALAAGPPAGDADIVSAVASVVEAQGTASPMTTHPTHDPWTTLRNVRV
jgi:acetyl/propionyl-CoA carboxylase alpha subunit